MSRTRWARTCTGRAPDFLSEQPRRRGTLQGSLASISWYPRLSGSPSQAWAASMLLLAKHRTWVHEISGWRGPGPPAALLRSAELEARPPCPHHLGSHGRCCVKVLEPCGQFGPVCLCGGCAAGPRSLCGQTVFSRAAHSRLISRSKASRVEYGRCPASAWCLQHALQTAASAERVSRSEHGANQTALPVASARAPQLSGDVQQNSRRWLQQRRQGAALPGARLRASLVHAPGSRAGCQRRSRGLQCVAQPVLTRSTARPGRPTRTPAASQSTLCSAFCRGRSL